MKRKGWVWLLVGVGVLFAVGGGVALMPFSVAVQKLGSAIASAEGFYVPGSSPQRNHNPGDLTRDINGTAIGVASNGTMIYATDNDGWQALYTQIQMWFDGTSNQIDSSMTIAEAARKYAENWIPWANNVANYLGVSTDTPLNQIA